jgi:hypothetical protein
MCDSSAGDAFWQLVNTQGVQITGIVNPVAGMFTYAKARLSTLMARAGGDFKLE